MYVKRKNGGTPGWGARWPNDQSNCTSIQHQSSNRWFLFGLAVIHNYSQEGASVFQCVALGCNVMHVGAAHPATLFDAFWVWCGCESKRWVQCTAIHCNTAATSTTLGTTVKRSCWTLWVAAMLQCIAAWCTRQLNCRRWCLATTVQLSSAAAMLQPCCSVLQRDCQRRQFNCRR